MTDHHVIKNPKRQGECMLLVRKGNRQRVTRSAVRVRARPRAAHSHQTRNGQLTTYHLHSHRKQPGGGPTWDGSIE
jgi:hypothetical protein